MTSQACIRRIRKESAPYADMLSALEASFGEEV